MSYSNTTLSASLPIHNASDEYVGDNIPQPAKAFFIVLGVFLMISGTLGNILVFVTLFKCPSLHSLHYVYVANLAVADFVIEAYSSPFVMYDLILGHHPVINQYVTRNLTLSMLVLVWVISAAVAAGPLFGWGRYGYDAKTHYCGYDRTASISYTVLIAVGTIGVPATAVCYFNYSIFR
ncbi:melatonin receptor type 1B [Elysia marginata]|uniref:Melatonin receptor type 1B n=1 Tax=Elysia marginata TaxID=1093978 RepID=A0AAV4J4Y5_9GAST|nr:melatonin receptor type 1B [Elysia marginata]